MHHQRSLPKPLKVTTCLPQLTSDNFRRHVSDGTHGISECVLQFFGSPKVTQLERAALVEEKNTIGGERRPVCSSILKSSRDSDY